MIDVLMLNFLDIFIKLLKYHYHIYISRQKCISSIPNSITGDRKIAFRCTTGPTRAKLNIFHFYEMNIDNTSLTSLNQDFKEYENINIDFDIDV